MKLYDLENVRLQCSDRFTLAIDAFTLAPGERVAIVGRNGSGKTTLLRLLAFLETPSAWDRFTYRDRPYAPGRMNRNGLGFLRQQPYLFRGNVAQNLAYPLKFKGVSRREIASRVEAMLAMIDLAPLADDAARRLSGGEQKRLALGRVLIGEPQLLLLDEPIAHLDGHSRAVIERLLHGNGIPLLVTTHDLHFAHRVADRVLNLTAGRISPSLPENVLSGRRTGGVLTTGAGLEIHLPPETAMQNGNENLMVMLDPRSLVISPEPLTSSMRNCFRGRVCSIREQGGNVWLEIDCGERLTAIVSRASYEELALNLNREVAVSFKANAVEVL